jgi:Lrp/AsnC family transcriptional regulator for asnA, asnC and gidA
VVLTAGRFDVVVEVVCDDDAHLLAILNTQIRSLPGYTSPKPSST